MERKELMAIADELWLILQKKAINHQNASEVLGMLVRHLVVFQIKELEKPEQEALQFMLNTIFPNAISNVEQIKPEKNKVN